MYALQLLIFCARLCFTSQPACWNHNFSSQLTRRYSPLGRPAKALSPHYPLSPPPCHCHSRSNEQIICQKCTHCTVSIAFTHNHPGRQVLLTRMKSPRLGDGSPRDGSAGKWQSQDSNWLAPPEPELYLLGQWVSTASRFWGCNQHLFFLLGSTLMT